MEKHVLSKSTFVRGSQCEKSLWLHKYNPEEREDISDAQQVIFSRGHSIGNLAQKLFPGGELVLTENEYPSVFFAQKTQQLIEKGAKILYEACFIFNGVLCAMDIMVKKNGKWFAYEVKSSTKVSDTYILDASLQSYLIEKSGLNLADLSIVYINNKYVRKGEIDVYQLFSIESILEESKELKHFIPDKIAQLKNVLAQNEMPKITIGSHCSTPYPCDFMSFCWPILPEPNVFQIANLKGVKKMELFNQGIISFEDITDDIYLSDKQWLQINSFKENKQFINNSEVQKFINRLQFPIYFMDFETIMPAIPLFDGSRPYQQICTQYSLHLLHKNGKVEHYEFLANTIDNPRIPFIEKLIKDVGKKGDILVYNIAFESTRLKEIANDYPQYSKMIFDIIDRLVDLMIPFQQKWVYYPEMNGSYSIKKVLPALCPDLSYEGMEIGDGGTAMAAFESLYYESNSSKIEQVRSALLKYCELDTWAMVKILEKLKNL